MCAVWGGGFGLRSVAQSPNDAPLQQSGAPHNAPNNRLHLRKENGGILRGEQDAASCVSPPLGGLAAGANA